VSDWAGEEMEGPDSSVTEKGAEVVEKAPHPSVTEKVTVTVPH